jgi:hypothetical protein
MDTVEIMLKDGAMFWAAGNNGTILSVDRGRLQNAGYDPESLCPAFKEHPRIALKIIHKSVAKGIAADEGNLQSLAVELLDKMGSEKRVSIPRILDKTTSGVLTDSKKLIYMTGVRPVNGHVEYLLMEWVGGDDFATLLYRSALQAGLRRTQAKYGEEQMLYELQVIMGVFLEEYILKYSDRLDATVLDAPRAYRIGGQLRKEIQSGKNPLFLFGKFLPEVKVLTLDAFRCTAIMEALGAIRDGNANPANMLIATENDTVLLERTIQTVYATQLLDYIAVDNKSGRREGFYAMVKDLVADILTLPLEMFENLRKALVFLNNQQYHHNDLHERNIMIGKNQRDIYIIDVATATYQKQNQSTDISIVAPSSLFYAVTHNQIEIE